jgi:hypothetical protein
VILATLLAGTLATRADLAEDYLKEIRALMTKKCYECHNAEKLKGDINWRRTGVAPVSNSEATGKLGPRQINAEDAKVNAEDR